MLGVGIVAGVAGVYLLLEIWPVLLLGGASYLIYKGLVAQETA